jgi:hypothetical protein
MTPRRINRGRGHSYELEPGRKTPGVTTLIREGVPKPQFAESAADKTARYAVDHWEELLEMAPTERLAVLKRARWEAVRAAGVRGTDIHNLAKAHLAGEEILVPEELEGHVDAYEKFLEEWRPIELAVERPVGNRTWRYMGTPDLIAQLADGQIWLLDWKTRDSGIWPEDALQLAAYRNAEFLLIDDETEVPMPKVDACGAIHLTAEEYVLRPLEAGDETFRRFLHVIAVAEFATADRWDYVGDALRPPEREAAAL